MSESCIAHSALGPLAGMARDGVEVYLGIPYATADRFAPPVAADGWDDVRDATAFGPIAPQKPGAHFQSPTLTVDEQCLSANVWTPGTTGARPVMVWIHGGSFRNGSGASPLYDGAALAARGDIVVITVNYRLGVLGFLGHPSLSTNGGPPANWGMLDLVEALRWVQRNATAFGGDPGDVTLAGESAGASAVSLLCTMPAADGLFHKAIAQSGSPLVASLSRAIALAERLVTTTGVADVLALRALPVERLLAAQYELESTAHDLGFIPAVDDVVIPNLPTLALAAGVAAGIPTLIGSNVDEFKLWAGEDPHSRDLDDARLRTRLEPNFPAAEIDGLIDTVRSARNRRGEPSGANEVYYAIESERLFRVPALHIADHQGTHAPTFVYLFGWGSPIMNGWLGSCHGLEIAFMFGNQGRGDIAEFTGAGPAADALAEEMMDAWIAFIHTGDPSTAALAWPTHDPATRPTMVFDRTSRLELAPRDEERTAVDAGLRQAETTGN